jgi:hypothetical protein
MRIVLLACQILLEKTKTIVELKAALLLLARPEMAALRLVRFPLQLKPRKNEWHL